MRTSAPNYIATEQLIWLRQGDTQVRIVARRVDAEDTSCAWDDEMLHSIFGLHGLRAPDRA